MKGFQTKLDVIGNNIANVNTAGFKKGRTTFQDMMSQSLSGAQGPVENQRGGVNPSQVGLGSNVGSVDNVHTQGNRQTTNRPLDLALEGDGMFVLANLNGGNAVDENAEISYTRAGNFYLDNEGYLVNSQGLYLVGQNGITTDAEGEMDGNIDGLSRLKIPEGAQSFSIQPNGTLSYVADGDVIPAGQVRIAEFSNPGGLQKNGADTFQLTENAGLQNDLAAQFSAPQEGGAASVVSGALEMSNVDLADEFTEMITAQRGFQANTRIITTSDEILQELVNLKR